MPRLWLRDDDAVDATPALDRFLALLAAHGIPAVAAVIPAAATEALARRLAREPGVRVAQHGFGHVNHAPAGDRKAELGDHRPVRVALDDLARGRARLASLFGDRTLPLLVPPWNRIAPEVARSVLAEGGARAVSTFAAGLRTSGLAVANAHVDIIDWRGGRRGKPHEAVADEVALALARARACGEPVGVLTHHRDHDAACDDALRRLFEAVAGKVRWLDGRQVMRYSVSSRSS
jgi:peptidoglycan/xylan/chitin deacetylase (PgdA/CDA1 family)